MTTQKEIINLILEDKKKSNTYDRYPIRFLFMKLSECSEDEIITLINGLSELKDNPDNHINDIQFINLHNLLSFEDGWITKSHLLNFINSLDPKKDYFVTGFSELIRFYSRNDLESLIISFMTNIEAATQKNKQRIYFVCYSLFDKIATELKSNSRNESIDPIIRPSNIVYDESEQICVYYASSTFDDKYFKNKIRTTTQWLSLYKSKTLNWSSGIVCISDTLVTLYEKAKPDNFVLIEKLDTHFKLLTNMFKFKLTYCEEVFEDSFWECLFRECYNNSCFELSKITRKLLNVNVINSQNFIELFSKSDLFHKRILYLYLKENSGEFDYGEYLISILDNSIVKDFSTFEKDIVAAIDMTNEKAYFIARKYFIYQLDILEIIAYSDLYVQAINNAFHSFLETHIFNSRVTEDNLLKISLKDLCVKYKTNEQYIKEIFKKFYNEFLSHVLLCITNEEKQLVLLLLQNELIELHDAVKVYPELSEYLGNDTSANIGNSLQWVSSYLYEYRKAKILNKAEEKFIDLVDEYSSDFPQWYLNKNFSPIFEVLKDEKYDSLIVLDGVGAEYFEYLLSLIKKNNRTIHYANICKCFLPSITDVNKAIYEGKYNEWITTFDKEIIHGSFYRPNEILPSAIDKIKEILQTIIKRYNGKRIALIADHGSTATGKIIGCKKKYSFDCEHEGRCMQVDDFSSVPESKDNDYYNYTSNSNDTKWLLALNGYSLGDNPKRESHGGATVEEVAVPCIVFSDSDEGKIDYSVNLLSPNVSGLNRCVLVEILPHIEDSPILEEESGIRHIMKRVNNNIWKCDINDIKTQNANIIIDNEKIPLLIQGTMGALIGGDGFDD